MLMHFLYALHVFLGDCECMRGIGNEKRVVCIPSINQNVWIYIYIYVCVCVCELRVYNKIYLRMRVVHYLAGCACGWNNASKFQKEDSTKRLVGISSNPNSRKMFRNCHHQHNHDDFVLDKFGLFFSQTHLLSNFEQWVKKPRFRRESIDIEAKWLEIQSLPFTR